MNKWEDRFFALNKEIEVQVTERALDQVARAARQLGWVVDDQFWASDLQVSRLVRGENELFLIQETYFGPKLTGSPTDIAQLRAEALKIDPNEELFAGRSPSTEKAAQNKPDAVNPEVASRFHSGHHRRGVTDSERWH